MSEVEKNLGIGDEESQDSLLGMNKVLKEKLVQINKIASEMPKIEKLNLS